jgi:hypothetical protein
MVMSSAFLSREHPRLPVSYRPPALEVEIYAHLIAEAEGVDAEPAESRLQEAELQLWVWRTENRKRSPRGRVARRSRN